MTAPVTIRVSTQTARVQAQPVQPVTVTPADGARVVVIAKPGPPGPEGPQGPAAPGGSGYLHTQTTPSAVWDVTHNLGQTVVQVAAVYNTDFTTQLWNVICEPLTADTCRLFFGDPVSGFALIHT